MIFQIFLPLVLQGHPISPQACRLGEIAKSECYPSMGRVTLPQGKGSACSLVRTKRVSCVPPLSPAFQSFLGVLGWPGCRHLRRWDGTCLQSSYSASPERQILFSSVSNRSPLDPPPLHTNRPRQTGNMRRGSRLGQFRSNILDSWALRIIPLDLSGSRLLRAEGCEGCEGCGR